MKNEIPPKEGLEMLLHLLGWWSIFRIPRFLENFKNRLFTSTLNMRLLRNMKLIFMIRLSAIIKRDFQSLQRTAPFGLFLI